MIEKMIAATHICKRFGKIEAVKDVSVTVKKGEVFGLIGTNGASVLVPQHVKKI